MFGGVQALLDSDPKGALRGPGEWLNLEGACVVVLLCAGPCMHADGVGVAALPWGATSGRFVALWLRNIRSRAA